jgi:hypothetical protein
VLAEIREVRDRRRQDCEHDCDCGADALDSADSRLDAVLATAKNGNQVAEARCAASTEAATWLQSSHHGGSETTARRGTL